MSNGRSMRRKLAGKSGRSPGKSKRRQRQQYQRVMSMQVALNQMSEATKPLLESVAKTLNGRKDADEDGPEDGVGAEAPAPEVVGEDD